MSLRCITERVARSQHDIDPSRPPGSSCCTLFCSRVAVNVLASRSSASSQSLSMASLQKVLLQAVRDWDKKNLVDGAPACQVLRECSGDYTGFELEVKSQECFVDRSGLQQILSETGDFAVLVTAIPHTDGEQQQRCGKTSVLLSLGDAVHLVDSHPRHPSDGQPAGMLRASVTSSHTSERAKVMCDWMWADDGFFKELRCNGILVEATVFRNAAPAKARPKDPSASAASSQSSARAASSPGAAGPHRSGSTECVGSVVEVGQDIPGNGGRL